MKAALDARLTRFFNTRDPSQVLDQAALDLERRLLEAVLTGTGDPGAALTGSLETLAYLHMARCQVLPEGQNQADLRMMLVFFRELAGRAPELVPDNILKQLAVTGEEPPDEAKQRTKEGIRAFSEYQRTGRAEVLNAALTAFRDALAVTPPGHPDLPTVLSNLGAALQARFRRSGDAGDLDAAIEAGQRAVSLTPPAHPDLPGRLSNLGAALEARFGRSGDAGDLDAAIEAGRRAAALAPSDHPGLPTILSNLGAALRTRFERAGDTGDLDAAIEAGQRAVSLTPPAHPDLPGRLSNLGVALQARFGRSGDAGDLDAAIEAGRRAAALTPSGDPDLLGYLSNLGVALQARFGRSGDAGDLDAAIEAGRRAAALTPSGDPDLLGYLSNLGVALQARFGRSGDAGDLDAAIEAGRRAAALTPPGHPSLPMILSDLGAALQARFGRSGDAGDLDAAIEAGRRAAALTPSDHPGLPMILSDLGAALQARFGRSGDAGDLDAAIEAGRRAAALTPPGHPDLPAHLSALGNARHARFNRDGDTGDLDAAIEAGRRAADLTPPGHPDLPRILSILGAALQDRFERSGDTRDLDAAITCWRDASAVTAGMPGIRLSAARSWGAAAADAGRTGEAAEGYAAAVGLLPSVAWHGLDRATREERLAQWAGLAADAAACAVLDGRPGLAVELLEQGRSVLWTQSLNLRSDLSRLAEEAPGLAERLDSIRVILNSPMPEITPAPTEPGSDGDPVTGFARLQQDAADLRRRKTREWDDVLAQVRALPGFGRFLAAIPYPELAAATAGGPVVIVNASRYGCHALITEAGATQPRVVSLPALNLEEAIGNANKLLVALAAAAGPGQAFPDREKERHAVLDVLDWLWDVIAGPVLTALGHTSRPETGQPWPRVWWCPTGPLTVLPVHAAGHHPRHRATVGGSAESVPDRVISSYTPTLTALARARRPVPAAPVRQLTIGMPHTPGLPPLPAVPAELRILATYFPPGETNHQLTGPQATHAAALAAIATHSWLHLACHAGQKHADPASSGFTLWDATLTITDLASLPTGNRDLAFLSACQTAAGSIHHLDEAIHLAAAMQFLGYRHVIATMWTIADPPAPQAADTFYTKLMQNDRPGDLHTAEALHQAVRSLRKAEPTNPLLWAPYIHLGS